MSGLILDGRKLAASVEQELAEIVKQITPKLGRPPGLAVVLVGNNPASQVYVKAKSKRAQKIGIQTYDISLASSTTNQNLQAKLKELSATAEVDGILLQLPLPPGLDEQAALFCVAPEKDVDGLHPYNQGLLLRGNSIFEPCTPLGCVKLIEQAITTTGISKTLEGLNAVVLGRSVLVGKPLSIMLLGRNCTVTIAHSRTQNLAEICRQADILVAAVGVPGLVKANWVKDNAIVIDVGINRTVEGNLVGDVDFAAVKDKAAAITPVPGGVGPMTIAMLLHNTVKSAKNKIGN